MDPHDAVLNANLSAALSYGVEAPLTPITIESINAEVNRIMNARYQNLSPPLNLQVWMRRSWCNGEAPSHVLDVIRYGDGFIDLLIAKPFSWWNGFSDIGGDYNAKDLPPGRYKVTGMDDEWFYTVFDGPLPQET